MGGGWRRMKNKEGEEDIVYRDSVGGPRISCRRRVTRVSHSTIQPSNHSTIQLVAGRKAARTDFVYIHTIHIQVMLR